jgi:hypothetical protein
MKITTAELINKWGLDPSFALKIAVFFNALETNNLKPRITSGWRDPVKQKLMAAAWDRGDRVGLRARPALDSLHTVELAGRPGAKAIDIVSNNEARAAEIAKTLNIGAGYYFKKSDPGHYFDESGRILKVAAKAGGGLAAVLVIGIIGILIWKNKNG